MLDPHWAVKWDYDPRVSLQKVAMPMDADGATRMPVWLFVACDGTRIISSLPVQVEVTQERPRPDNADAAYVFACRRLHVFASASTYEEAENQFHDQVVHFYRAYLEASPNDLADDAVEIRDLYRTHFQVSAEPHRG